LIKFVANPTRHSTQHNSPNVAALQPSPLLYADSASNADQRYFGRVQVPDPFISFGLGRLKFAVVNVLEFERVKRESAFDTVLRLETWLNQARAAFPGRTPGTAEVIALLAQEYAPDSFVVPEDFPAGVLDRLRALGLRVAVAAGPLFPGRIIKTAAEAAAIRQGNRAAAAGIAAAEGMLRAATIRQHRLFHSGRPLTSERLKTAIEIACLEAGATSLDTIAAGGDQGCAPHDRGHGPLRADELIVVDVFPRVTATGYHGDMTRTFLKGRASDAQRRLVATVRAAQKLAFATVRAGATGKSVHDRVAAFFKAQGYETASDAKGTRGFFHGTGHGLGLAVHEPPRLSLTSDAVLSEGTVVTVEPGLYYPTPGPGGCRIEDVVQVTASAPKILSKYHYDWEIP
jgi:Xaa-Pro aminopeptidase